MVLDRCGFSVEFRLVTDRSDDVGEHGGGRRDLANSRDDRM